MYTLIGAIVSGIVLGFLGGSVWILIPWGIVGIVIGYFSKDSKKAVINGAIFGFLAAFFFMIQGYSGTLRLITRIPFFAGIGLIGAVGGIISSFAGSIIKKGLKKK